MSALQGGAKVPTLHTIWSFVLPASIGVPVWNVLILLNFFRRLPGELEEAAFIDGAGHWTTLWKIYLPTSLPAIATLTLFVSVFHWNSWFDGMIYMRTPSKYPLQTFLASVPILLLYPFLQRYFVKGVVLGSGKG